MIETQTKSPWLLTTKEAAQLLAISPRSLWQLAKDRKIPVVRIGRSVRFDTADVRVWIERQKQESVGMTPPPPGVSELTPQRIV